MRSPAFRAAWLQGARHLAACDRVVDDRAKCHSLRLPQPFLVFAISVKGSAPSSTKFAEYPASTRPRWFDRPNKSAVLVVAVSSASMGERPALTKNPSSS